jgi:hypothetical protein
MAERHFLTGQIGSAISCATRRPDVAERNHQRNNWICVRNRSKITETNDSRFSQ